jgi:hypothetical protein
MAGMISLFSRRSVPILPGWNNAEDLFTGASIM